MFTVLAGMAALIAAGVIWRLSLGADTAESIRAHLARAVYEVFLPALVLHVMWQTACERGQDLQSSIKPPDSGLGFPLIASPFRALFSPEYGNVRR